MFSVELGIGDIKTIELLLFSLAQLKRLEIGLRASLEAVKASLASLKG